VVFFFDRCLLWLVFYLPEKQRPPVVKLLLAEETYAPRLLVLLGVRGADGKRCLLIDLGVRYL
jgi:hypothetical protein